MRYSKCQEVPTQHRQSRPAERERRAQKERRQKSGALFNSPSQWCNSSSERWERGARSLFLFICSPPPLQPTCTRLLRKKRAFFFQLPPPLDFHTAPGQKMFFFLFVVFSPTPLSSISFYCACIWDDGRRINRKTPSRSSSHPHAPNQQRPLLCLVHTYKARA